MRWNIDRVYCSRDTGIIHEIIIVTVILIVLSVVYPRAEDNPLLINEFESYEIHEC